MRNVASFIRMCTNIRFCQPEGQHRTECASRVLYGYPLLGAAPLRDPTDIQKKMRTSTPLMPTINASQQTA